MKKILNYLLMISVFTALWIVLNEKAGLQQIVSGIILSFIALAFTNYYLLLDDYQELYYVKTSVLLNYFMYVVIQIYKSGFSSIGKIIKGDHEVKIIEYESCIDDELLVCLLANAITLTPGTVTIDKSGNKLKILCFETYEEYGNTVGANVCTQLEEILKG